MELLNISEKEATTLQRLAEEIVTIGNLPIQKEKATLWQRLNEGNAQRPMVYINEEPWSELDGDKLVCSDPTLRDLEIKMRRDLYSWHHCRVDQIITPLIECPKVWSSTGIGIEQKGAMIHHNSVSSQQFSSQISCMEDIEKIQLPDVSYNHEQTDLNRALFKDLFDGIAPVQVTGIKHIWFTPWDHLIRLVNLEDIMMAMIDEPELIDAFVSRYVDAKMHELDQIEALGLLDAGANNTRVGSGAYGYSNKLPATNTTGVGLACDQLWGCGNAQIFSDISPTMHWDFSLKHEMRWLDRWGMTYYGCCEPLHLKMGLLKKIKNLRKISVSPWFDIPQGLEHGAGDYILSVKANPAIFAEDRFNEKRARSEIRTLLDQTAGCHVELIMKDISTLRNDPQRLSRWAEIAMEEVQK